MLHSIMHKIKLVTWDEPSSNFLEIAWCASLFMDAKGSLGDHIDRQHEEDVGDHLVDKHDRDPEDHRVVAGENLEGVA